MEVQENKQVLVCINNNRLAGNEVKPPLVEKQKYILKGVFMCDCGQDHYDVGLESKFNYVSCYKCKKPIPGGDTIHWCHPSRFEKH